MCESTRWAWDEVQIPRSFGIHHACFGTLKPWWPHNRIARDSWEKGVAEKADVTPSARIDVVLAPDDSAGTSRENPDGSSQPALPTEMERIISFSCLIAESAM